MKLRYRVKALLLEQTQYGIEYWELQEVDIFEACAFVGLKNQNASRKPSYEDRFLQAIDRHMAHTQPY